VSGADAQAFLHGQLTADIRALAPHTGTMAAWCTAKGRVLASMIVLHLDGEFRLILDRTIAPGIARRLSLYVLRSKVQISDDSARRHLLGLDGNDAPPAACAVGVVQRVDTVDWLRLAPDHWLGVATLERDMNSDMNSDLESGLESGLGADLDAVRKGDRSDMDWRAAEIALGRAWIGSMTQDTFTPQMINLDLNGGVSFTKGCYPGQEIVARTHYLGKVKRRMRRARVSPDDASTTRGTPIVVPQIGMGIFGAAPDAAALGQVVDLARCADGSHEVLYVGTLDGPSEALYLGAPDGPRLEPLALPYSID
jgi:folate-binding protein YgfZ